MGTTAQEAGSGSPTSATHGSQLVVRNTFLELTEDSDLHDCGFATAPRRARALTDLTDSRSPQKEEYPVDCCIKDSRGDATPSTVDMEFNGGARLPKVDSESCLAESEFKLSGRRWCDEVATDLDEVASPWGIDQGVATEATLPAAAVAPCHDAAGTVQAWSAAPDMQYMMFQQGMAAWWGCHSGPGYSTPAPMPHLGVPLLSQAPAGARVPPPQADATRAGGAAVLQPPPPPQKPPQPTVCVKLDSILNLEPPTDAKDKAPPARASRKKGARNRGGSQEPPRGSQGASGATEAGVEGKPLRSVKTAPGQLDKMAQEKADTPTRSTEKQRKSKESKESKAQSQPKPPPQEPQTEAPQEPPQAPQQQAEPLPAEQQAKAASRDEEDAEKPQTRPFESIPLEQQTTVMLRNIPNQYTQTMLLSLLSDHGFGKCFDFVYLPMDFRNGVNLGYAFVNLATHEDALQVMEAFQAYGKWAFECCKLCEVSWAHPHQGLHEHVERYRNSPVMHPCMPDEYKPMLFSAGERMPFPEPSRPIRPPKLRPAREKMVQAQSEGLKVEAPPVAAIGA